WKRKFLYKIPIIREQIANQGMRRILSTMTKNITTTKFLFLLYGIILLAMSMFQYWERRDRPLLSVTSSEYFKDQYWRDVSRPFYALYNSSIQQALRKYESEWFSIRV